MPAYWEQFASWGERAKKVYHGKKMTKEQIRKVMDICNRPYVPGRCEECPLNRGRGCTDCLNVVLYERLQKIDTPKAKSLIESFNICFSADSPDRCFRCDYRGIGCSKKRMSEAWEIIKEERE